jgi:ABC-type glycerol-3-phosphate transport system substrate-binding protein
LKPCYQQVFTIKTAVHTSDWISLQINKAILSILFATVLLIGCSGGPAPVTPTALPAHTATPVPPTMSATPATTPTPSLTPTPGPSGTLTILVWGEVQDWISSSGILEAYARAYPGVKLRWVLAGERDIVKMLSDTGNGAAPDLVFVTDQDLPGLIDQGALADISMWMSPYEGQTLKYKQMLVSRDKKVFALPVDTQPAALFYRRDVFEKAGLPSDPTAVQSLVSTWDGFLIACRQIHVKTLGTCFAANKASFGGRLLQMMAWQSGAGLFDAAGNPALNSAEFANALVALAPFWKENLAADTVEGSSDWLTQLTDNEKPIAAAFEPARFAADLKTWVAPGMSGKWGVAAIPTLVEGQAHSASMGGTNLAVTAGSPNEAAARSFMEFLFLRADSQNELFTSTADIPAIHLAGTKGSSTPSGDAYFGGQTLAPFFAGIADQIPAVRLYGKGYPDAMDWLNRAARLVAEKSLPAQKALDQAQSAALGTPTVTPTPTAE